LYCISAFIPLMHASKLKYQYCLSKMYQKMLNRVSFSIQHAPLSPVIDRERTK